MSSTLTANTENYAEQKTKNRTKLMHLPTEELK